MSTGCEQMQVSWVGEDEGVPVTPAATVAPDGSGGAVIQCIRNALSHDPPYRVALLADVDGPVRSAFLQRLASYPDWALSQPSDGVGLRQGRSVLALLGGIDDFPEAIIGQSADAWEPVVLQEFDPSGGHGIATSRDYFVTTTSGAIGAGRYDGTMPWQMISNAGSQLLDPTPWGETIFWRDSNASTIGRVISWSATTGVAPFISFGNDTTQAVYGFNTDGTHHAWVHFKDKPETCGYNPDTCPYATADIMAAPFTTDPSALAPKRLRSWPSNRLPVRPMAVGCGYAAYGYSPGHTLIVRIEDGVSWELPSTNCTPPNFAGDWCFEQVFGITCDHVYVRGGIGVSAKITRAAIAELGPGTPPD